MKVAAAFPADVATLASTRRFVGAALEGMAATAEQVDAAVLVTNELAANAMCHATEDDVVVRLRCTDAGLRIEVDDRGTAALPEDTGEMEVWSGLRLVETHCSSWGVERTETGKRVWALVDVG